MIFRRAIAVILVFLFIISSVVTFVTFAVSKTFLEPEFYRGPVQEDMHDFAVKAIAHLLIENDELVADHFTEADLRWEIEQVFSLSVFSEIGNDIADDVESLRENPDRPVTISLKLVRESMFTLAHNLSFKLFEAIPECEGSVVPEVTTRGLPTCIPAGVEYDKVISPYSEQFEKAIFASIPEQVQIDLTSTAANGDIALANIFYWIGSAKSVLYIVLVSILVLIAIIIYKPFVDVLLFEGLAFLVGGALGYILSLFLEGLPKSSTEQWGNIAMQEDIQQFIGNMVSYVTTEIQKIALIFVAFGAVMILVKVFLQKR